MKRLLAALLLALTLSACAPLSVNEADRAAMKEIGVVSTLGETFHGISIGTTVFNNEYFSAQVGDWKVDQFAAEHVQAALQADGSRQVFVLANTGLGPQSSNAEVVKVALERGRSRGADTVIVVVPTVNDNYPYFRKGYGLFERSMFGNAKRCVYSGFRLMVLDVRRQTELASNSIGTPCLMYEDNDIPFKSSFEAYTDAEKQLMRSRLERWIATSADAALKDLKLTK